MFSNHSNNQYYKSKDLIIIELHISKNIYSSTTEFRFYRNHEIKLCKQIQSGSHFRAFASFKHINKRASLTILEYEQIVKHK